MDYKPEGKLENYPKWVSLETTEEIIKQMKTKICKIYLKNGIKGTGFFCKISLLNQNNKLNVLITNNHIINEEIIKGKEIIIKINNKSKRIELDNRIKYTNKEYDVTIIEIKKEDEINCEYFENEINNFNEENNKESIYILHYPGNENISVSYGIINVINQKKNMNFNIFVQLIKVHQVHQ